MGKSLAGHVTALHRAVEAVPPSGHAVTDQGVPGIAPFTSCPIRKKQLLQHFLSDT